MPSSPPKNVSALSSRAKRGICFCGILSWLLLPASISAQNPPTRPRITGIDHVRIDVSDSRKSSRFHESLIGIRAELPTSCLDASRPCFLLGWLRNQGIELEKAPAIATKNRLAEIAFRTDEVAQLRRYPVSHGVTASTISKDTHDKHAWDAHFEVQDPEGNPISFIQRFAYPIDDPPPAAPWYGQLIHVGLIVHDRAAEDRLYKDILGFHVYWHGGRKDDEASWVDMQVPNGTDWIEYMLNVPADVDQHTIGVMNHIAVGVPDIHAADEQLRENGWSGNEQPKIGRDGKWQLKLYDPDDTRVELMEFTPTRKPPCSAYTGPHPGQHP